MPSLASNTDGLEGQLTRLGQQTETKRGDSVIAIRGWWRTTIHGRLVCVAECLNRRSTPSWIGSPLISSQRDDCARGEPCIAMSRVKSALLKGSSLLLAGLR